MPKERPTYICNYCGSEFYDYDEALACESSHEKDFNEASLKEILNELEKIRNVAPGYHIYDKVLGYPTDTFCSIIDKTINLLKTKN